MWENSSATDGLPSISRMFDAFSGRIRSRLTRMVLFRSQESSRALSRRSSRASCIFVFTAGLPGELRGILHEAGKKPLAEDAPQGAIGPVIWQIDGSSRRRLARSEGQGRLRCPTPFSRRARSLYQK